MIKSTGEYQLSLRRFKGSIFLLMQNHKIRINSITWPKEAGLGSSTPATSCGEEER